MHQNEGFRRFEKVVQENWNWNFRQVTHFPWSCHICADTTENISMCVSLPMFTPNIINYQPNLLYVVRICSEYKTSLLLDLWNLNLTNLHWMWCESRLVQPCVESDFQLPIIKYFTIFANSTKGFSIPKNSKYITKNPALSQTGQLFKLTWKTWHNYVWKQKMV